MPIDDDGKIASDALSVPAQPACDHDQSGSTCDGKGEIERREIGHQSALRKGFVRGKSVYQSTMHAIQFELKAGRRSAERPTLLLSVVSHIKSISQFTFLEVSRWCEEVGNQKKKEKKKKCVQKECVNCLISWRWSTSPAPLLLSLLLEEGV